MAHPGDPVAPLRRCRRYSPRRNRPVEALLAEFHHVMTTETRVAFIDRVWSEEIVPALRDYIEIPNQSPQFDAEWERNGHMQRAVDLVAAWCRERLPAGASLEVVRLPGRTPVLLMELEGASDRTVLLYGHLDKQPPMTGRLGQTAFEPWKPVLLRGDKLYGRGGADDGYAAFASADRNGVHWRRARSASMRAVWYSSRPARRVAATTCRSYIDALADRIGRHRVSSFVSTRVAETTTSSGCTTSLRGMARRSTLKVEVLNEGVHSGDASGIVPSSVSHPARELLDASLMIRRRRGGSWCSTNLNVEIPERACPASGGRGAGAGSAKTSPAKFPLVDGDATHAGRIATELILNRTWRPAR